MKELLENKKVIIVGPSSYLEGKQLGSFIDSFDIVVRINNFYDISNKKLTNDLGKKANIFYYDGSMDNKRFNDYLKLNPQNIICTYPETEWFFEERCLNNIKVLNKHFNNSVINSKLYNNLKQKLNPNMKVRPNSGLIAIVDLLKYPLKELYITGIDFYRSSYASYHPDYGDTNLDSIKEIFRKGDNGDIHDINKQFQYFKNEVCKDQRINMDNTLKNYIQDPKFENVKF